MLCGINVILAVSLNLVNGFTGQFSIGHAGFMAVGALRVGDVHACASCQRWARGARRARACPTPVAQGARAARRAARWAALLAALAGWLVGLPSLRLRGDYLAIVTLGFGEIIRVRDPQRRRGRRRARAAGHPGAARTSSGSGSAWSRSSSLSLPPARISTHGRALLAIREDEIAAEALGVDTTRYKVTRVRVSARSSPASRAGCSPTT